MIRSARAAAVTAACRATARTRAVLACAGRKAGRHAETWRTIRGQLLTPWFAVSAGLVVAASLTIATPRAVLTFPHQASSRCANAGCAAGPVRLRYTFMPRHQDRFGVVIVITGRERLPLWSLRLELPGARVRSVDGGAWTASSGHGIVVRGSLPRWQWPRADLTTIVISGTGAPGPPGDCVFDGTACRFRASRRVLGR